MGIIIIIFALNKIILYMQLPQNKKPKYYDFSEVPKKVLKDLYSRMTIKVFDYHYGRYFYGVVKKRIYKKGKIKYILEIDNGNKRQPIWYSIVNRRWEVFTDDK